MPGSPSRWPRRPGGQVDPEALPFRAIELAGNAVEFDAVGEHWRCRLDSYVCERAGVHPAGNPLKVPSPDKKVAVSGGLRGDVRHHLEDRAATASGSRQLGAT